MNHEIFIGTSLEHVAYSMLDYSTCKLITNTVGLLNYHKYVTDTETKQQQRNVSRACVPFNKTPWMVK